MARKKRSKDVLFGSIILGVLLLLIVAGSIFTWFNNQPDKVEIGDTILLDYTLSLDNGMVIDTSDESLARAYQIYRSGKVYGPTEVRVVHNAEILEGVLDELMSMREGENRVVSIPPSKAFGFHDPDNIGEIEYRKFFDVVVVVPVDDFNRDYVVGQEVPTPGVPWKSSVLSNDGSTIQLEALVPDGASIPTDLGNFIITRDETTITSTLFKQLGELVTGPEGTGIIVNVTNSTYLVDFNSPLSDEFIVADITVVRII